MTGDHIFWVVVGGLIASYIAWQVLWVDPRKKRSAAEAQARWAEAQQKREIGFAEVKQRRLEERIRSGEEEWRKKLAQLHMRLDRVGQGGVFRCTGRNLMGLLEWQQLEEAVAFLVAAEGWQTELTGAGPDRGVDIRCRRTHESGTTESLVVQVKHFVDGSVGAPVVRQIVGAAVMEHASKVLVATSARFAKGVREEFGGVVELWDGDTLSHRIDSLSDEQFERLAQPYKLVLGDHALAERKRLNEEQARLEQERGAVQRLTTVRENQLRVLKHMEEEGKAWPACPRCGKRTAVRLSKTYFWGCTSYPSCHGTRNVPTA